MRATTRNRLFTPAEQEHVRVLWTTGLPNGTVSLVQYLTRIGEVRTVMVQEWADIRDGFTVYVDTPNGADRIRERMRLDV